MMTSNAYIATDGENVMKVGKANDVKRRERQIALPITCTVSCLDEAGAFRVENQLRDFVIKRGGVRYLSTIDWFKFDAQIYEMLREFATRLNNEAPSEIDVDTEIAQYITYYHQLLVKEAVAEKDALQAEIEPLREAMTEKKALIEEREALQAEIRQLQRENAHLQKKNKELQHESDEGQERIYKLIREESFWETRYKLAAELLKAKGISN